ncbi:membrane fusion protein, cobalt-zinc-cadmium efflux system [Rhodoblastus acidophilus]|uniref:Membrane fusion protein, cobalt-zinc-cadmium efflux system n=1 Tax=Rhodoblastus acidophilus TaxID=1074 RepID=A0A212PVW4_RHOAC|nr:efflux RND transporter periplasmic adaptor subunit [Rhodoblastus acidophilus]PPQ37838.1 efflux RND transporter periplasmic adaptor subunit [Rhodoblastus acidophilus]RAI16370.1 efflux RND transporter periplasmic adaptor subunit [Rhodoblastus acidophilus]SNB51077.1 membrane fusion protein, cobalt-zinc-cadmium efflux system [Rhodoblastus acidophilus]
MSRFSLRPALLALALCLSPALTLAKSAEAVEAREAPPAHGEVPLAAEQIDKAGVAVTRVEPGVIAEQLSAPGVVIADQDRIARVPARVIGSVAELRKRLGETVAKDEVVAMLDSREVADAKSEWQAALVNCDLQKTLFERAEKLWAKRISAEQVYLQAKTTAATAQLRLNLARQKLRSLGVSDGEIDALRADDASANLGLYPVRAPIAGRVIERKVDVGASVGGNNDPSELYAIADLSRVWIDLAIPASELNAIREGQKVSLRAPNEETLSGQIIFIGPVLNPETRAARVLAAVDNPGLALRPGGFVTAAIAVRETPVALRAPKTALQTIEGKTSLFVRNDKGFVARAVGLGRSDAQFVEITEGLTAGETIASENSFILKAELGKAEAAHDD